jgi:hypothetical protein
MRRRQMGLRDAVPGISIQRGDAERLYNRRLQRCWPPFQWSGEAPRQHFVQNSPSAALLICAIHASQDL